MPMYDTVCPHGHEAEQFAWSADRLDPCGVCGETVERILRPSQATVIGDDIPGGLVIDNLGPRPLTFYSHSERRAYMRKHGIHEQVRHVGAPGSDKSRHTSRWI